MRFNCLNKSGLWENGPNKEFDDGETDLQNLTYGDMDKKTFRLRFKPTTIAGRSERFLLWRIKERHGETDVRQAGH